MALQQISEEYLRSVSPLARRISDDLLAAREAYQDVWSTLSTNEQNEALDEALIDPAIVLKYSSESGINPNWRVEPISQFSWFTKSQLNLCSLNTKPEKPKTPMKKTVEVLSPVRRQVVDIPDAVKPPTETTNLLGKLKNRVMKTSSALEEKQCLVERSPHPTIVPKTVVAKPKTPPPPPPTALVPTERRALLAADENPDDIPKTGFDFLDNW